MNAKSLTQYGRLALALVFAAVVTLLTGCTQRFVDYTLLSTKNIDLSKASSFKRAANRVTAEDAQFIIIFIPTSGTPNLKEAVDRAIEGVPGGVALVDGVVSMRGWWFILGENAIIVEGTPLIDPSLPGASASLEGRYKVSFINPQSRQQEVKAVDQATFLTLKESIKEKKQVAVNQILLSL